MTTSDIALLVLEDGTVFKGRAWGAKGRTLGEIVFSTGMTGLETALPIIIETMVNTGRMDWADVARVMSTVPAQIGRVKSQGQGLVVGAPAHVTLVDATARVTVDPAKQWTRSTNCPFRGMELPGQVRYTIYNGVPTVVDATPIAKEDR